MFRRKGASSNANLFNPAVKLPQGVRNTRPERPGKGIDLNLRLEILREEAEDQIRMKLLEARAVVQSLETQLSEITDRPTSTSLPIHW
jgi:hypothetical protein